MLAIVTILMAVLVPKVFASINSSRFANATLACQTVRTALADHFAKYGSFTSAASSPSAQPQPISLPACNYDAVLLREQLLDKQFAIKVGDGTTNTQIQAIDISGPGFALGAQVDGNATTGFALAGGATNSTVGSVLVEAVITGVSAADAQELNDRIDGTLLGGPLNAADFNGRVKYAASVGGSFTVYVYLAHR